jgi:uncharacterized protein YjdB
MMKKCSILKILSLTGCIAAMFLLVTPAVSAEFFYPTPYSLDVFPGQYPVYGGPIAISSGSLVSAGAFSPSYIPLSPGAGIIYYPSGSLQPVTSVTVNPAITGPGSGTQTYGAYYTGSGTRSSGFSGVGARFMCSL